MAVTDNGRFVAIETMKSGPLRSCRLTLRFCESAWDDGQVLRLGFMYDDDDDEVCWLTRKQVKRLIAELTKEYGDGGGKASP